MKMIKNLINDRHKQKNILTDYWMQLSQFVIVRRPYMTVTLSAYSVSSFIRISNIHDKIH